MANYNNNYGNNNGGYNRGYNGNNGGYNRGYNNGGYNRNNSGNQQQFKKSGATYTRMKNGKFEGLICVNAWRKTKQGLMRASAFPVDGVIHVGKEKGNEFMRYVVNVVNSSTGQTSTFWCLMRLDTKIINIKELSLCISTNGSGTTASGKRVSGYFGRNFKS